MCLTDSVNKEDKILESVFPNVNIIPNDTDVYPQCFCRIKQKKKSNVHSGLANCQSSNFQNFLSSREL